MSISPGYVAWKVAFQLSPILFVGGITGNLGVPLPIVAFTEAINLPLGLLSNGENIELDDFFANFQPLPGATLVEQEFGRYPFANQQVATNAVIFQPKHISMLMQVPARNQFGYYEKLAIMELLQATITLHNQLGGSYTILTPSYIYTGCVMKSFRDVTVGASHQVQTTWQLDFEQPLLTADTGGGLVGALNSLYTNLTNGTQSASVAPLATTSTPLSGAAPSVIPSSSSAGTIQTSALPALPGYPAINYNAGLLPR